MLQQNAAHFLNGVWIRLTGVARAHDELRLDAIDVRAVLLDDAVVAVLDRAGAVDGDD